MPLSKILDDGFWGCLLKLQVFPSKQNTPDKVYDLLIPYASYFFCTEVLIVFYRFLAQAPLEAAMAETTNDPAIEWRSPQRAGMAYFRVILESLHYLMRRKGLPVEKTKQVILIEHHSGN